MAYQVKDTDKAFIEALRKAGFDPYPEQTQTPASTPKSAKPTRRKQYHKRYSKAPAYKYIPVKEPEKSIGTNWAWVIPAAWLAVAVVSILVKIMK
jgi:hypothetical protein